MGSEPLTKDEAEAAGALMTSVWSMLKSDSKASAEEAVTMMKGVELDCGDGMKIPLDDDKIRQRVENVLNFPGPDLIKIAQYMFDNPGPHSAIEIAEATGTTSTFASIMLYKLRKRGFVREVTVGASLPVDADGNPIGVPTSVVMHQISADAWLKELQQRKDAGARHANDDGHEDGDDRRGGQAAAGPRGS